MNNAQPEQSIQWKSLEAKSLLMFKQTIQEALTKKKKSIHTASPDLFWPDLNWKTSFLFSLGLLHVWENVLFLS